MTGIDEGKLMIFHPIFGDSGVLVQIEATDDELIYFRYQAGERKSRRNSTMAKFLTEIPAGCIPIQGGAK